MNLPVVAVGTSKPLVIAHRGARAFAPENTLEAIDVAAALRAEMVEFDVQLAADGGLVVVHDDTLERCSDVRLRFPNRLDYSVASFTVAEIQSLDAGSWFVRALELDTNQRPHFLASLRNEEVRRFIAPNQRSHYASGSVRHPTLDQALDRAFELRLAVNIELKAASGDCCPLVRPVTETIDLVARRSCDVLPPNQLRNRVLVSSFDHAALRRLRELRPDFTVGVLTAARLADPVAYCRSLGADAYHPGCMPGADAVGFDSAEFQQTGRLPAEPFRSLRAAGIAVNVWTENDPEHMKTLIAAGVTGIFTDYPNRLRELLNIDTGTASG